MVGRSSPWCLVQILNCGLQSSTDSSLFSITFFVRLGFPGGSSGKELAYQCKRHWQIPSLGQKDPLQEGMATHSSILAWRILWTEELGGLQSIGSQRDRTEVAACTHTLRD